MLLQKIVVIFISVLLAYCESTFLAAIRRCTTRDTQCQRDFLEYALKGVAKMGVPELNVPPLDPLCLKNITASIYNVAYITLIDGVARGIKNCAFNNIEIYMEKGYATLGVTCDIKIEGLYRISSTNSLIQNILFGDLIHGEGKALIKLERFQIKFDFYFYPKRRQNGQIYIKLKYNEFKYIFSFGKVTFFFDNLYLENQEVSELVTIYMNRNWKLVSTMFGNALMDKVMEMIYVYTHEFFDKMPAEFYIKDDLSAYLKN